MIQVDTGSVLSPQAGIRSHFVTALRRCHRGDLRSGARHHKDRKRIVDFCCKASRKLWLAGAVVAAAIAATTPLRAEALLVVEADTGKVLQAENAPYPWYPASVTKIMTAYVTLKAVKEG